MTIKRLYLFLLLCGSLHAADWSLLRRSAQVAACAATAADATNNFKIRDILFLTISMQINNAAMKCKGSLIPGNGRTGRR